jgi:hypothetical protein
MLSKLVFVVIARIWDVHRAEEQAHDVQGDELVENLEKTEAGALSRAKPYLKPKQVRYWSDEGPFYPPYPELCSVNVTAPPGPHECHSGDWGGAMICKAPGVGSHRIALVFRGDSFRGLSYGVNLEYCTNSDCEEYKRDGSQTRFDKLPFFCTPEAVRIQQAIARAQLKLIVEPLEKAGMHVDIYLSTYGCSGMDHLRQAKAGWVKGVEYEGEQELVKMYGHRVVAHALHHRRATDTQDTGVHHAMRLLLNKAPLQYESVLLWRYDVVPLHPMGPPTIAQTEAGKSGGGGSCQRSCRRHHHGKTTLSRQQSI